MEKQWKILFCDATLKPCPVEEFVMSQRTEHQIKLLHFFELLEEMGPQLPRPYADTLRNGIHELRIKLSGVQIRLLYFFCFEKYIVFFNVFPKYGYKVPERYIQNTIGYRDTILKSIDREHFIQRNDCNSFDLIAAKLADPQFKRSYEEHCNVCTNTVSLIQKYYASGMKPEELTSTAKITIQELKDLEEAENCRFRVVEQLCRLFGLPVPTACVKERIRQTEGVTG